MGRPPPIIRAMPERKRFFSVDPFPYSDVPDAADRDAQFELDSDKILL